MDWSVHNFILHLINHSDLGYKKLIVVFSNRKYSSVEWNTDFLSQTN